MEKWLLLVLCFVISVTFTSQMVPEAYLEEEPDALEDFEVKEEGKLNTEQIRRCSRQQL